VVIEVIDEGAGIEPALHSQLFQPFFTTKTYGTGLGLAICKEIADFHRAKLRLTSRGPGSGTVATVEIPVAPESEAADVETGIAKATGT
jgi:signal transduction histidine kinase